MDEAQEHEIMLLSDMIPWASRIANEQTRMIMYASVMPHVKKMPKITKFWPLETDHMRDEDDILEGDELKEVRKRIRIAFNNTKNKNKNNSKVKNE